MKRVPEKGSISPAAVGRRWRGKARERGGSLRPEAWGRAACRALHGEVCDE